MKELKKAFVKIYGGSVDDVRVFSAAGRINLIGEHIDYCGGPVLPAALSLRCLVAARKRSDNIINLAATTIDKTASLNIDKLESYKGLEWGAYQAGVAFILQNEGYTIQACDLLFDANIPFGSGLSSSAAIEVATAFTLSTFSKESGGKGGSNKELAVLCQKAENEYAGVNCGIMDQFASAMGKKNNAIYLNCATLDYEYIPLDFMDYTMVIANSNKHRSLQESKYNERRAECEEALLKLQGVISNISCLADVSIADFEKHKGVLNGKVLDRAEHVIYECDRVKRSATALKDGNLIEFGRLLNESHMSLKDKYEVTGFELDALTSLSRQHEGCIGSRMTGAGFGGCTISLVKTSHLNDFLSHVAKNYQLQTNLNATFYPSTIEQGAFEVKDEKL